ncbi:MAG: prolyl oligopeptidase family serine peptidase [Planctomycetes bacterium]|nr:prolyl oligopeptidase family serine peptidase [Planctomycetota bacterium]
MNTHLAIPILLAATGILSAAAPLVTRTVPSTATGFIDFVVKVGDDTLPYVVYVPKDYDPATKWPVIMFLHGSGECGTDGLKQVGQGIGNAILHSRDRWPCIVVFPQKPNQKQQWEDFDSYVMASLSAVREKFSTDPDRLYLSGLSQGGHGTWTIGAAHPKTWAALVPICGYGDPASIATQIKDLPIWCFHGGKDDVVPPQQSRDMIDALKKTGADPKYTEFPDANHNSWDAAYAEPGLPQWLLSQRKKP